MSASGSGVAEGDWDAELLRLGGHFLQSTHWQRVQRELGYAVTWSRGERWMWAAPERAGRFPRYWYLPHGPTAAADADAPLLDLSERGRAAGVDFARVEPVAPGVTATLRRIGARPARSIQPASTWVLDLGVDEDVLRKGLERGHRSRINAASRRGITVRSSSDPTDIETFISLQELAGARSGWQGRPAEYHRVEARVLMPAGAATLYIAEAEGRPVAAAIAFDFGATRHYAHSASDPELGRRLGAGPPLLWRMITDARGRAQTLFDFWGVTPEQDPGHPWAGFSAFKRGFGGRLVQRAGTWDLPIRQARYRLYAAARRFR